MATSSASSSSSPQRKHKTRDPFMDLPLADAIVEEKPDAPAKDGEDEPFFTKVDTTSILSLALLLTDCR
jgi:hypothetical protein